jgi:hypothetical protein
MDRNFQTVALSASFSIAFRSHRLPKWPYVRLALRSTISLLYWWKCFLIVVLQHAQFDCYSQHIITRQSRALFPRRLHPLVASRGIYRLQYLVKSEIRGVENEPYTFILCVALLLRIGRVASITELYRRFPQPYGQNANIVIEIRP